MPPYLVENNLADRDLADTMTLVIASTSFIDGGMVDETVFRGVDKMSVGEITFDHKTWYQ